MAESFKSEVAVEDEHGDSSGFLLRLRQAIDGAGGRSAVSVRTKIPERTLGRYLSGDTEANRPNLAALALDCGVSLDWLVFGKEGAGGASTRESATADVALIRQLTFRASAGHGQLVFSDADERVPVSRLILKRLSLTADRARMLEAAGDSMMPTIHDGDPLLVDTDADGIIEGRIYAFTIGNDAFVKRLRRAPGKILMISDNRELYPEAEEIPEGADFRMIGRVRWVGRSL